MQWYFFFIRSFPFSFGRVDVKFFRNSKKKKKSMKRQGKNAHIWFSFPLQNASPYIHISLIVHFLTKKLMDGPTY